MMYNSINNNISAITDQTLKLGFWDQQQEQEQQHRQQQLYKEQPQ